MRSISGRRNGGAGIRAHRAALQASHEVRRGRQLGDTLCDMAQWNEDFEVLLRQMVETFCNHDGRRLNPEQVGKVCRSFVLLDDKTRCAVHPRYSTVTCGVVQRTLRQLERWGVLKFDGWTLQDLEWLMWVHGTYRLQPTRDVALFWFRRIEPFLVHAEIGSITRNMVNVSDAGNVFVEEVFLSGLLSAIKRAPDAVLPGCSKDLKGVCEQLISEERTTPKMVQGLQELSGRLDQLVAARSKTGTA